MAGLAVAALGVAPSAAVGAGDAQTVRAGGALARVQGHQATLHDARVTRLWSTDRSSGGVVTTALADGAGHQWSVAASPDFSLTIDGVQTSSDNGWRLIRVTPEVTPPDPSRPAAGPGVQLRFEYESTNPVLLGPLRLDRTYALRSGAAVLAVTSVLSDPGPAPVRVGAYSLDELTPSVPVSAEVQAYHGGSDWRDDFRSSSRPTGAFDQEGEVVRFDGGSGAGWFFVSGRRGGLMSRVGEDAAGRTWVGVDNARDAFDSGPITAGSDYNRFNNPAYPVPVRQRTVAAGGSLFLGRAYTGVYSGGADAAPAAFVDEFVAHEMPSFARSVGLNSFHPWGHGPGLSDVNLRPQVDTARALGVETFMLDDQWQGSSSGDWVFDPSRFPDTDHDGRPDFVDYVHAKGLSLGLWMSPLEFNPSSQTYASHPEWACTPLGDVTAHVQDDAGLGVWDVTNPSFRAYLTGVIDRLIAQDSVTEFKFDFMAWVDCPPHDYLDYEDAFVALVRSLEARHPGVTFQLDETNDQRAWPFESATLGPSWFDNGHLHGSTAPARLLHDVWSAAPWLPPSSLGFGTYDPSLKPPYTADYLMPMSLLGHVTFWTDLRLLAPADAAETAWWLAWYRNHRQDLSGLVYEDTAADPLDGSSWAAFQPWHAGAGYVFAFRQSGGPERQSIALRGLEPRLVYRVTDVRTTRVLGTYTGQQLSGGLPLDLPRPYSAIVLSVAPAAAPRRAPAGAGGRGHRGRQGTGGAQVEQAMAASRTSV